MPDQCFNEPKQTSELSGNSYWLSFCQPQGYPCFSPTAPDLDSDTTVDTVQANTLLYKATKPEDYDADIAYWLISRVKPGVRQQAYLYVQRTGVPSGLPAGTVKFGAPGLTQPPGESGWEFVAQVSYCSEVAPGTIDKCTCYSSDSAIQTTAAFDAPDPDGTAAGTLEIDFEDQFRRPNTTTTITSGQGLGPPDVWLEVASGALGRPTIIDTERVSAPQGTNMVFVGRLSESPQVYTEVLYRRATSPSGTLTYNVDASGRTHIASGSSTPKALAIKLVNESAVQTLSSDPAKPELQIRSLSGNTPGAALQSWQIEDIDGTANGCDGNLPLADDASKIIFLRFESDDGGSGATPRVRAFVGWGGCTEDGGLASCTSQCSTDWWIYTNDPLLFSTKHGWWGFFVHHRAYRVEAFRAGSAPAQ